MIVPGSVNPLLLATGGYEIPYSLRFRAANSAYLSRTSGASPTNQNKVTYSAWIKAAPSISSSTQITLVCSSGNNGIIGWNNAGGGGKLFIRSDSANDIQFAGLFRDPSAWGNLVISIDTTQATSGDRVKVYWNGSAMTYVSGTYPSLNSNTFLNAASTVYRIFSDIVNVTYLDGYLAEMYMIDGQALTPSSFGQTDSATGVWVPKAYAGTYGTNGFYLKFADASAATAAAIGKDSSGNGNNWTPSGISVTSGVTYDQMTDTPTLNYCVLNPIDIGTANMAASEANMKFLKSGVNFGPMRGTFGISSGKWYFEMVAGGGGIKQAGVSNDYNIKQNSGDNTPADTGGIGAVWDNRGFLYRTGGNDVYSYTFTNNDVVMVAYDFSSGKVWFGKNGTWNTGDPSAGTNPAYTVSGQTVLLPFFNGESSGTAIVNFGQRAFAYTPPTGFKALNTANLPTPSIKKGSLYMNATLRTGTGATASVSSLGFQPDLVWIKSRSAATDHGLYDAVRGVQKQLESNTTTGETTETTGLTAFNSNGYTVGTLAQLNTNTATYVDWAWKEGATPGFDIVTYTGNGTNRTISHALGAVPKFMVVKRLDTGNGWVSYHASQNASPATGYMYLNSSAGFASASTMWNNTAPTSSVFSVGTNSETNGNTFSFVGYLWAEIEGFSKFGSYTGNGSTDGPFVWCGFRPRWIMIKRTDSANSWPIFDTARNITNVANAVVAADQATAESSFGSTDQLTDILSNGFKLKTSTSGMINASGGTYIFAAFAENPFKYSRAR